MELLYVVIGVALIGFLVWAIVTYVPMPPLFRNAIVVIAVIAVVLWVASMFLGGGGLPRLR